MSNHKTALIFSILSIPALTFSVAQGEEFKVAPRIEVLLKKGNCWGCHGVSEQRVGPPFQSVAQIYADATSEQFAALTEKVRFGGAGKWGAIPMTPHPELKQAEITELLTWVLQQNPEKK